MNGVPVSRQPPGHTFTTSPVPISSNFLLKNILAHQVWVSCPHNGIIHFSLALWGAIAAQGEADYDMFLVHLPVLTAVKPEHLDEIAQIVTRVAELGWFLKEDESLTRFLEAYLPLLTDALDVGDFLNGHFKQFFETLPGPDEDSIKQVDRVCISSHSILTLQFLYAFKLYKVQLSEENEASLSNFKGKQ